MKHEEILEEFYKFLTQAFGTPPACPQCGADAAYVAATRRFGCPGCYSHYADIERVIRNAQGGATRHAGKRPRRVPTEQMVAGRIASLEEKMRAMVEQENYEAAALLRDVIKALREPSPPPTTP